MGTIRTSARALRQSAGLAALAFGASVAGPALAQEAVPDIIVVAQKRSENIQDVPISVSAISAAQLSSFSAGGADVLALAGRVPGLNVESSNGRVAPRFYIRGLGNVDFDLAASQPVSVIMDDVVMENVALKSFPLFDIQQVEVLRGPQGTLYGRNTPAGIVNIRSARPTDTFEAVSNISWGTYNSATFDGAVSGPLGAGLSGRASLLVQHRDDWVDNTYPGANNELGGFDELAGRLQLLFEPSENFSALLNIHGRSLDGTATLFRANVFTPGSNDLNSNFDRDKVYYNGGNGNPQEYDNSGAALTLEWNVGGPTLTSITAYETVEGFSTGDIDGGAAFFDPFPGPGFIPFDSASQDSIDGFSQITQEVRLASPDEGVFRWQIGAFYFDSEYEITTLGGAAPTTVEHSNTSWAVFGQGAYEATDRLTLTAGVRYTDDEKDFRALAAPPGVVVNPTSVSDSQVSWDLSATYEATPDVNLYARVASGFRAPTIQGRDVAFTFVPTVDPQTVARSETILSVEAGVKADVLDGTGRINAAVYHYTIDDQQFSIIGGAGNINRIINANEGEGYGFELEGEFNVTENFFVTASAAYNHTEIKDATLSVVPCGSGACTPTDPTDLGGNRLINGNPFPQAPEVTLEFTARYSIPTGNGGEWFADTDWTVRSPFNIFLYEAIEFETDMQFEGGLRLGYARQDGAYEVALFARNITDEENVIGAIDFNNLTGFVNEPRIVGVSLRTRFN